jgi:hypothetical protein
MIRSLRLLLFASAFALAVFSASCGTDHAQVRYVHASADTAGLDVAIEGKTVVTDLLFGTVSPASGYLTVTAGSRRVEMRDTGTTNDQINSTVGFATGKAYTLIASGLQAQNNISAVLLTDDHSAPASGHVRLRIVHVAPGILPAPPNGPGPVNVYIVAPGTDITGLSPTIPNLAYTQASAYQEIAAGAVEVIVTKTTDQIPIEDQTYNPAAGQNRTLVLLDTNLLELADLN